VFFVLNVILVVTSNTAICRVVMSDEMQVTLTFIIKKITFEVVSKVVCLLNVMFLFNFVSHCTVQLSPSYHEAT